MRHWLGALAFLLAWQALFWPLVHFVERAARPVSIDARSDISFRLADANGTPIESATPLVAPRTGLEGYLARGAEDGAIVVFRIPFEVADANEPLALYLSLREQIREIRLNGTIVQAVAPVPRLAGLITSEPSYYPLPPTALRTGANELEVEKDAFGFDTSLSEFAVGPANDLAGAYRWRTFLLTDLGMVGVALLLFTVSLCLVVNWPAVDKPRIRALVGLLSTCALATYFLSFNPPIALSLSATILIWAWVNVAIALTIAHYAMLDAGAPRPRRAWLAWPILFSIVALIVLAAQIDTANQESWLVAAVNGSYWLVIGSSVVSIALLAWASAGSDVSRWFDRTVLAICFSAFAMDRVGSIFDLTSPLDPSLPLTLPWSSVVGALLGLSMVLALAREAAQARHTVLSANAVLEEKLSVQERALAESYELRNRIMQRATVLEERQRIVRDMHDGIGGQLLGLKLQIGAGQIDTPAIQDSLDASITDMRLIVDSLDMADESFSEAMRAFEDRVRNHIEAAGCVCVVHHGLEPQGPMLGPHKTLQVLRILQEAVTNALRHSHAKQITIASAAAESGMLILSVSDDGVGLGEPGNGRGLSHMRHRAEAIGAGLDLISEPSGGTRVQLTLAASAP